MVAGYRFRAWAAWVVAVLVLLPGAICGVHATPYGPAFEKLWRQPDDLVPALWLLGLVGLLLVGLIDFIELIRLPDPTEAPSDPRRWVLAIRLLFLLVCGGMSWFGMRLYVQGFIA